AKYNWSQSKIYHYKLKRKVYDSQIGDTGVLEDGVPPNDLQLVKNNYGGCSYEAKSSVVCLRIFASNFQGSSTNGNDIAAWHCRGQDRGGCPGRVGYPNHSSYG